MYNGPSVNATDDLCVKRCALSMCCTFSNHFIWIKLWSLFSGVTIITLKKLIKVPWGCSIMVFVLIYVKEWKNIKGNIRFNSEDVVHMLHFLKLIKFTVLFYFASSDQSEMVVWLKSKSLKRYQINLWLKTVTKTCTQI